MVFAENAVQNVHCQKGSDLSQITSCPASTSFAVRTVPIYPLSPVTRILICTFSVRHIFFSSPKEASIACLWAYNLIRESLRSFHGVKLDTELTTRCLRGHPFCST